ncbi:hypothetical protein DPMN_136545 [Dreissena polymorpha]|uniref:Uncharacterized protein n=1 Tax=Dreissena polymorpha TaxID=45954 RepID=A0A9D4G083_DREPO|nr:hypothetical protein DPMN_136545 [Dreissena polymorpha]
MRCQKRFIDIKWKDCIQNSYVIELAGIPGIPPLLTQRPLDGFTFAAWTMNAYKRTVYGQLATCTRPVGRPALTSSRETSKPAGSLKAPVRLRPKFAWSCDNQLI